MRAQSHKHCSTPTGRSPMARFSVEITPAAADSGPAPLALRNQRLMRRSRFPETRHSWITARMPWPQAPHRKQSRQAPPPFPQQHQTCGPPQWTAGR